MGPDPITRIDQYGEHVPCKDYAMRQGEVGRCLVGGMVVACFAETNGRKYLKCRVDKVKQAIRQGVRDPRLD